MVFALVSCSTEELGNGGTPASGKGGVRLVLSTDGFDEVGSRAVDEKAIHDVNILEYKEGKLEQVVYLDESEADFSEAVEVSGLKKIPATEMVEETDADGNKVEVMKEDTKENFVFVVANYGSKIDKDEPQLQSLAGLQQFKMKFSGKTDLTHLPMTGFYYKGVNPTSATQMNVTLQRVVAKINFTLDTSGFKVDGKTPSQLVVNSIELCNVPSDITLYPCKVRPNLPKDDVTAGKWNFGSDSETTHFPTKDEMEADGGSVTYGDDENHSSDANTYVAYIPENARGSYDGITDNKDKRPYKCDPSISEDDEASDKCFTYIRVVLSYVTSDNMLNRVTYRIYLGGNSTGDMNLLRKTQYNVATSLTGIDSNDTRITVKDMGPADEVMTENANCYMIDMSDALSVNGKLVTIPLKQVNDGWDYIKSFESSQSSTAETVKKLLESGEWEIQTEWKTWEGSSNVTGTKSADFSASNLKATLTIPADVTNGNNAVVKLVPKSDNSKTYWSWHLWFTNYKPDEADASKRNGQIHQYISNAFKSGGTYYGKYMMDRNLGATIIRNDASAISQPSSTSEAIKYYGLMYQFGRKDPFIGSGAGNANFATIRDASGKSLTSGTTPPFKRVSGGGTSTSFLATAVMNPSTFYTYDGNWTKEQNGLWFKTSDGKKTPFDPCPPGWRVPLGGTTVTQNPWAGFGNGNASSTSSGTWSGFAWKSSSNTGAAGALYNYNNSVQAWYPASGYIYRIDGNLGNVGSKGFYWGAMPFDQVFGCNFCLESGRILPDNQKYYNERGFAFPVRCIQE